MEIVQILLAPLLALILDVHPVLPLAWIMITVEML